MERIIYKKAEVTLTLMPSYDTIGTIEDADVYIEHVHLGVVLRRSAINGSPEKWVAYSAIGIYVDIASSMDEALTLLVANILARS